MNIAQAKSIPLDAYLEHQGHSPAHARQGGRELWYRSPIRGDDDTPSFKIDTAKNVWFDHGLATGGTIIDLVTELCACNVRDALRHLEGTGLYSPALPRPATTRTTPTGSPSMPSSQSSPRSSSTIGRSAPSAPSLFDADLADTPYTGTDPSVAPARSASRRTGLAGEKEKDGAGDALSIVR